MLNDESNAHLLLLDGMDHAATEAVDGLHAEARHIDRVTHDKKGYCWLYVCIFVEVGILFTLLYIGFS